MIYVKKDREVIGVTAKSKIIMAVYQGAILIWEAIRSCFGSGVWISAKPWLGADTWKNTRRY